MMSNETMSQVHDKVRSLMETIKPMQLDYLFSEKMPDNVLIENDTIVENINSLLESIRDYVISGENLSEIMVSLTKEYKNELFWKKIDEILASFLEGYNDTIFLRKLSVTNRNKCYSSVLSNMLKQGDRNDVIKEINIDVIKMKEYNILVRFLNTCIEKIIGEHDTKDAFRYFLKKFINLDEEDADYIFSIIMGKKHEYQLFYLTKRINMIFEKVE